MPSDLSPLASILGEITKLFPNEFPRAVDRAKVKEISGRLSGKALPAPAEPPVPHTDQP
jgi:hypothetical protein